MKIAGIDPKSLSTLETLVLPRGDGQIVFQARGLRNMDEFNKLCPEPLPPRAQTPDGIKSLISDDNYLKAMGEWSKRQTAYMVVKSLEPSAIEWDTVRMDKPATWANWREDLMANDFSHHECNLIFNLCWEANQLDEDKLKKAREAFLRGPQPVSAT